MRVYAFLKKQESLGCTKTAVLVNVFTQTVFHEEWKQNLYIHFQISISFFRLCFDVRKAVCDFL